MLLSLALCGTALAEPERGFMPSDQQTTVSEGRARALERLVRQDCGSCHGMTLKGGLGPDIRAERFAGVPVEVIAKVILDGIPGTPMPPWRPLLSNEDATWIAHYLSGGTEQ